MRVFAADGSISGLNAGLQLVVLPHAGGAAYQFGPLAAQLPPGWSLRSLELPGRGRRVQEPFLASFDAAVADFNRQLATLDDRPWVLLGHSLGAHLGTALLRSRWAAGQSLPRVFFSSGAVAPSAYQVSALADLPSEAFWVRLSQLGGTPQAVLADADYRLFFETILRADLALLEQAPDYADPPATRVKHAPLPLPVVVLMGLDDLAAPQAASWQSESALPLVVETFAGGHFYLFQAWSLVAKVIVEHSQAHIASLTDSQTSPGNLWCSP